MLQVLVGRCSQTLWCGEIRNEYVILLGKLHGEENHLEVLDIDGEMILKRVLEK